MLYCDLQIFKRTIFIFREKCEFGLVVASL